MRTGAIGFRATERLLFSVSRKDQAYLTQEQQQEKQVGSGEYHFSIELEMGMFIGINIFQNEIKVYLTQLVSAKMRAWENAQS